MINRAIGRNRALPERRATNMRAQGGRIHRHAQIHRQRGGEHNQRWRVFPHQLQRRELGRTCDNDHGEGERFENAEARLGCEHTKEHRKRDDYQYKRSTVAKSLFVG